MKQFQSNTSFALYEVTPSLVLLETEDVKPEVCPPRLFLVVLEAKVVKTGFGAPVTLTQN